MTSLVWEWLRSDAAPGWVACLLTGTVWLIDRARRKRPLRVIVEETERRNLSRVHAELKDRVRATFDGEEIAALNAVRLRVFNDGSELIDGVAFVVDLQGVHRILDIGIDASGCGDAQASHRATQAEIELGYLNPWREHKQQVDIEILVDGPIELVTVRGAGRGWSLHPRLLPRVSGIRRTVWLLAATMLLGVVIALLAGILMTTGHARSAIVVLGTSVLIASITAHHVRRLARQTAAIVEGHVR